MRWLFTLLIGVTMTLSVQAETYVYVSLAQEQKIQTFKLNAKDGTLTAVASLDVKAAPGCLTFDPQKKYLFASLRSNNSLASFSVDAKSGKLTQLSSVELPKGENAAHLSTDRTGRWLISASYSGGKVVVHGIGPDGKLQAPAVQTITTVPTAHCIATDPSNTFVLVPHVNPNSVYQYHLDVKTGQLKEASKAPAGKNEAGPRHLAFHPKGGYAYSSDEKASTITAYEFNPKTGLKAIDNQATLPADFKEKNTTAEVKVHPSGKFVWVSNRGHESLAGFAIDAATGKVKSIGQTPTEKTPRSFDIEASGQYLFGAGEGSGKLAVFQIDLTSGKLTRLHTLEVGKSLTWVQTLTLGE